MAPTAPPLRPRLGFGLGLLALTLPLPASRAAAQAPAAPVAPAVVVLPVGMPFAVLEQGLAAGLAGAAAALDRAVAEQGAERARFAALWRAR